MSVHLVIARLVQTDPCLVGGAAFTFAVVVLEDEICHRRVIQMGTVTLYNFPRPSIFRHLVSRPPSSPVQLMIPRAQLSGRYGAEHPFQLTLATQNLGPAVVCRM